MSDNIKVVVKVRPLISREIEDKLSYQWKVINNTLYQIDANGKESGLQYTFDKVYDVSTKTEDVYKDVAKPIVVAAIAGFNGTIFAYGQTSSGKTYTMSGTETSPGIIQMAVFNLFEQIKCIPDRDFLVRVSYIEIYNETLKDLLNCENDKIKIRETLQGVKVETTEKFTSSPEEVLDIMREGEANRQTGATNMNEESSRSHSIFQITIESREHTEGEKNAGCVNVSQLNLVDLAGSERAGQTGATGKRFKEGTHINKSLSVLALVIKQLSEGPHKHANYRDSKLTRILQNSLGGNAKTSIICAVTPAAIEETISTLQFANRAKAIKNKPEVNAVATDATKLQDLTKQLSKLQSELAIKNHIEQDNRLLMKQIANLQKMILNGFGQSSIDIGGARRKTWCAPRRMTISTPSLRSLDEREETAVQRFCTPSLKYNPLALATPREFQTIQRELRESQLPSVSEETAVTPPPKDKKVNFNDEIIDLDSDEDNASNTSHCSPYHKCYNATKTPPCVLRRKAKTAEKDLKDIVELTKREKMYNPEVVEYMEKLEQSTNRIAKLEDEIKLLGAMNVEKDSEVELLKDKIAQTKQEVLTFSSAKVELEAQCKEYNTKLTDLEVSYETLKIKSKLREEELLSRINDQTNCKKVKESTKSLSRTFEKDFGNFMDMSKDISLVSDNDSSIDSSNNEPPGQLQRMVEEMRTDVAVKNEAIVKLESELLQQKLTIDSLERSCTELREQIKKTNSTSKYTEEENTLLKSSIDTLNSTINSQKENLESANNDIKSYVIVVKELQAKLVDKKYDAHISINDISLEKMIDNEEKFIANNENMRNIIHSLKNAIELRNKEIDELKSNLTSETSSIDTDLLTKQLEEKEQEIVRIAEEAEKTKEKIHENMDVINKLIDDNKDLKKSTDDLSGKLLIAEKQSCELEKRVQELEKENKKYADQLHEFNENHDKVLKNLNDLKENLSVIQEEKEALLKLQHGMISKDDLIGELKSEITTKDSLISTLSSEQIESRDYLCKWKSTVSKVQQILSSYISDASEQEELIDDASSLGELCEQLNSVENTAKVIVSQKEEAVGNNNRLQEEIEDLKSQVEYLILVKNKVETEKENQNQQVIQLNRDSEEIRKKLSELNEDNAELNTKLQLATEGNDILKREILEKEEMITSIKNEENNIRLRLEKVLQQETAALNKIEDLQTTFKSTQAEFDANIQAKNDEIEVLKHEFNKKESLLCENYAELQRLRKTLEETIYNQDQHLDDIYKAAVSLLRKLDDQNDAHQSQNSIHTNVYSKIIHILDKVTNGIVLLRSSNEINNSEDIKEATELLELKEQNHQLINKLSSTEYENSILTEELQQIKFDNHTIGNDLLKSDETLKQLQDELHEKLFIIEDLESKINEWKNNFSALEDAMKQQLLELQISNSEIAISNSESQSLISMKRSLSVKVNEPYSVGSEFINSENDQRQTIRKSLSNMLVEPGNYSPQSLLTLCCNRIIDAIPLSETELDSSSSNTYLATTSAETQTHACDCDRLLMEKELALDENLELKAKIDHLHSVNIDLLKEQEEIRKELKLLMEPAHELQKKISSHKTNLSTLTATTYAENKLLKSQVKVLQYHNNRIYNVCERDLPGFKKSLQELSSILKNTAVVNRLEANIKRFSLPEVLDRNSSAFKDESTLDGDLLMLDTNVTIASVDNTLLAQDQTCLDATQIYLDTEINTDIVETIDPNILHTQLQMLTGENERLTGKLTTLKAENLTLHEKIGKLSESIKPDILKIDAQNSPMKLNSSMNENPQETTVNNLSATGKLCEVCMNGNIPPSHEKITEEINKLTQELIQVQLQNSDLEKKYNTLKEDMLVNDRLALKISALEKDNNKHLILIDHLTKKLSAKNEEFIKLQEENNQLSTQIMESIDETDDLRKEVDTLKDNNKALSDKCGDLEDSIKSNTVACIRCARNTSAADSPAATKSALNRSRSDSESSSRCNKLSTLQNELLAGREDCRTISEDVASIKNHLERGELSMSHDMDLDDSMGESNVFAFTKELHIASPKPNKFKVVTEIPEERSIDIYALDKADCFNYYIEKTGAENNLSEEIRIIEVMKMFYNNLVAKHGNEVENLVNNLKDFEESRNQLHEKINQMTLECSKINEEMKQKDRHIDGIANTFRQIRNNINKLNEEISSNDADPHTVLVTMFKNKILSVLDNELDLSCLNVFENLIDKVLNKQKIDLIEMMDRYSELQGHTVLLTSELRDVTDNLKLMKSQLGEKEKEYNLLKAQKEKVHEITSAVTRDIVQREKELTKIISNGCQKLIERNIMIQNDIDTNSPVDKQIAILIEKLLDQSNQSDLALQEKHNLALEMTKSKIILEEKDQELESLKSESDQLRELCKNATNELLIKNEALESLKSLHEQLHEVYKGKVIENEANARIIENMTQELDILKSTVDEKDNLLQTLQALNIERNSNESETKARIDELMESINSLEHENKNLKSVNDLITKESEENAVQLAQADDTLKKNKSELEKLTAEILTLNQSLKESMSVIEGLKCEAKSLIEQNATVKKQFEEATDLCSQLKLNIKTHEKTAGIQCKIISRLKQEKETRGSSDSVKEGELKELSRKCDTLQKEFVQLAEDKDKCQQEAQELREAKQTLERRVSELEGGARSAGGTGDARRRRQSRLDSKRSFDDTQEPDHKKIEAFFSTQEKPDDMFMDVEDHSNRSTPARNRRSDSFQSRHEESEESSRPNSAMARRQRRQSLHDQHRPTQHTQEHLNALDEITKTSGGDHDSELASLKDRLRLCQQELEELQERYREVDEECETCAEYLRERDQQCMQLKVENKDLQQQISKLNDKLQNASIVKGQKDAQRSFANASVNTDEDWANLHSVVVDRMSFDREVERNKTLQRTVDELRYKHGELKAARAKARKASERAHTNRANLQELEATKLELETCKRELEECRERCKELDEECETCGEYLRERDEQMCRLKEARDALEAKLEAMQDKEAGSKLQSVRKKRQSVHDQNRDSIVLSRDAATDTAADLHMESDNSKVVIEPLQSNEVLQLKMALEALARQKQALEMQLRAPALLPPVYVATGSAIVQNQHLTEVMKENQKLKRMNAKLITICKKRGKPLGESNRENDDPVDMASKAQARRTD